MGGFKLSCVVEESTEQSFTYEGRLTTKQLKQLARFTKRGQLYPAAQPGHVQSALFSACPCA